MNVVVAGGTGFLGADMVRELMDAGHSVAVLGRSKPVRGPAASAAWIEGDVRKPETLRGKLAGYDAVVDAVQFPNSPIENPKKGYTFAEVDLAGTKNLVDAAREGGVGHFIDISGVGAASDGRYHWLRYKWDEEQHTIASGVPYTIFRGSWVYGPGDVSLNRFLGFARFLPFVPVIGNGKTRINPLLVSDFAAHVVAAVVRGPANVIFEIGGPDVLTMDEIVKTALRVSGKRRYILHQPKALMKIVAGIVQFVPGRPLTPDAIDFITMDGVADTGALKDAFGLRLTPLEEGLRTYLGR
jgi:NADH dehydrogenase